MNERYLETLQKAAELVKKESDRLNSKIVEDGKNGKREGFIIEYSEDEEPRKMRIGGIIDLIGIRLTAVQFLAKQGRGKKA